MNRPLSFFLALGCLTLGIAPLVAAEKGKVVSPFNGNRGTRGPSAVMTVGDASKESARLFRFVPLCDEVDRDYQ